MAFHPSYTLALGIAGEFGDDRVDCRVQTNGLGFSFQTGGEIFNRGDQISDAEKRFAPGFLYGSVRQTNARSGSVPGRYGTTAPPAVTFPALPAIARMLLLMLRNESGGKNYSIAKYVAAPSIFRS